VLIVFVQLKMFGGKMLVDDKKGENDKQAWNQFVLTPGHPANSLVYHRVLFFKLVHNGLW
jgi:hypothetical protein